MTKPFKIYIAGSDQQTDRADRAFVMLARLVDPAVTALSLVSSPLTDSSYATASQCSRWAEQRLAQLRSCHVMWMLVPRSTATAG